MKIKAYQFDIRMTDHTGQPIRRVSVASNHPNLYQLAHEAEQRADKELMRAVTKAAIENVSIALTVVNAAEQPEGG